MDDLLALTVTKEKFKDPVDASYYMDCHNTRNQGGKNEVASTALCSNEHLAIRE